MESYCLPYTPPSEPPAYQEVSPSISKVQSFTTPDNIFTHTEVTESYVPSNPSINFINMEVSLLSSKSVGSHQSGCDLPSETRPMDTAHPVSQTRGLSNQPSQWTVSVTVTPSQPYCLPLLHDHTSKLSGHPPTPAALLLQIIANISDSTPINSNPCKPASVRGGWASHCSLHTVHLHAHPACLPVPQHSDT